MPEFSISCPHKMHKMLTKTLKNMADGSINIHNRDFKYQVVRITVCRLNRQGYRFSATNNDVTSKYIASYPLPTMQEFNSYLLKNPQKVNSE